MNRISLTLFSVLLLAALPALAQEHPEHPQSSKKEEHPKKAKAKEYSTADLEKAIKTEIAEQSKKTGGMFEVEDAEMQKTWRLTLDRVHTERLSKLSTDTYFACVDMKDADGTTIDVDFFLKSKDGKLEMTDTTVHKIAGNPRYNWEEKDGLWKRVPLKEE